MGWRAAATHHGARLGYDRRGKPKAKSQTACDGPALCTCSDPPRFSCMLRRVLPTRWPGPPCLLGRREFRCQCALVLGAAALAACSEAGMGVEHDGAWGPDLSRERCGARAGLIWAPSQAHGGLGRPTPARSPRPPTARRRRMASAGTLLPHCQYNHSRSRYRTSTAPMKYQCNTNTVSLPYRDITSTVRGQQPVQYQRRTSAATASTVPRHYQ